MLKNREKRGNPSLGVGRDTLRKGEHRERQEGVKEAKNKEYHSVNGHRVDKTLRNESDNRSGP